jgi:general secretion pathway protein F
MPLYRYQAIGRDGAPLSGERDEATQQAVALWLQGQGHFPLQVEPAGGAGFRWRLPEKLLRFESGGGKREVALFTYELSVLLQAGFPVDRALQAASGSVSDGVLKAALARIVDDVRGGGSLAAALRQHPKLFPPLYCALVEAGEASGALSQTLERLADDLTKSEAFRSAISSALLYPALLVVLAVVSVIFILLVVVPSFRPMLADAGVELPWSMTLLLLASDALSAMGGGLALLAAVGVAFLAQQWNRPVFRRWRDAQALRLPMLRDIVTKADTARLCRSLGLLLTNGAPLTVAWRTAVNGVGNAAFQARLAGVAESIAEGDGLALGLDQSGVVTQLAVHMIRVGEQTGRLGAMADQAAGLIERDVKRRLDRFLAILVPALTIGVGAMIAFLVATVFSALLSVNQIVV